MRPLALARRGTAGDKGWTRLYITHGLDRFGPDEAARIGDAFALFVETLEPLRREAVEACPE